MNARVVAVLALGMAAGAAPAATLWPAQRARRPLRLAAVAQPPAQSSSSQPPGRWLSAADYNTVAVSRRYLATALSKPHPERTSAIAGLTAHMLLTVRLAPGRCALFVAHTYAEVYSIIDSYPGEDFRPLARMVGADPTLVSQCRPVARRRVGALSAPESTDAGPAA